MTAPGQDYFPTFHDDGLTNIYLGSGLLTNVQVVTIFWGDYWTGSSIPTKPTYITDFFDVILSSSLIDMLAEYNLSNNSIGHGSLRDSILIPSAWGNFLGNSVTSSQIRELLYALTLTRSAPYYGENTLYMIYVPDGTSVTDDSGKKSCTDFEGYHDSTDVGNKACAIGVICPCSYDNDRLTIVTSHELCEAITHPISPRTWLTGWNGIYSGSDNRLGTGNHIEIGDECYRFSALGCTTPRIEGFAVQPIWSRRQAACAIMPWPIATFPYPVRNSPAIASDSWNLIVAWTIFKQDLFTRKVYDAPILIMSNEYGGFPKVMGGLNGLLNFTQPIELRAPGDPNPQYSIDSPALAVALNGTFFIAWTAGNDPQHHINIMSTEDPRFRQWNKRITLDEWSNSSPSLAFVPPSKDNPNGVMVLAFTGMDGLIRLRWSTDGNSWPDSNKATLRQWSLNGPCICYSAPYLYIAFRATTGDQLFVCRTSNFGQSLESIATIPGQATDYTPALTLVGSQLMLTWRSSDFPYRFYGLSTDITSSNPLSSFGNLVMYGDTASGSVSMVTYQVDGKPYITWAGTDPGHSLNVMPLPPYLDSCFS